MDRLRLLIFYHGTKFGAKMLIGAQIMTQNQNYGGRPPSWIFENLTNHECVALCHERVTNRTMIIVFYRCYVVIYRVFSFLTCVSHTAHIIDIGWTSVCPSVCPSVTRWYCVETAQPIVKLSSLPGSPMILFF